MNKVKTSEFRFYLNHQTMGGYKENLYSIYRGKDYLGEIFENNLKDIIFELPQFDTSYTIPHKLLRTKAKNIFVKL